MSVVDRRHECRRVSRFLFSPDLSNVVVRKIDSSIIKYCTSTSNKWAKNGY